MYAPHRDKILELRAKGYSYGQIQAELGCSKGTVSFHIGKGQKDKYASRRRKRYKVSHPCQRKLERFCHTKYSTKKNRPQRNIRLLYKKLWYFCKGEIVKITVEDVINKLGENPVCYLTGESIDLNKPRTYQFDHIIPKSRGGSSELDNLGICTKQVNQSKTDMTPEEYIELCKQVLKHNGYTISKSV